MIKEAIVKIVNKGDLSYDEAYAVMNEIMSGETTPTQNAAFLAALSTKSARAETTDEIAGCAAAMRDHATKVDTGMDIFEIVGTGGDNAHSFNISTTSALVAAAGSSSRMGGTDKLMEFLDNVPVLMRTLTALQRAAAIDEIVIAAREDALVDISTLCKTYGITKCSKVVRGGESRCHSVLLAALEASPEARLLAVQDGARPLVTPALIDRTVEAAAKCGAAAPAVPVKDTIKTVAEDGAVTGTPDRSTLRAVQTPQVFEADLLKAALQSALENEVPVTDDCSAVERLGKVVYLIDGDEENLKITTPVDLVIAEAILAEREGR